VICVDFSLLPPSNLAKHKHIHNTDQVVHHACMDCNKTFSNENNLKRHDKEYHCGSKTNLDLLKIWKRQSHQV
jgi:hypothetical protein